MDQKRFRFIVSSAEEAVAVMRDRIGENARVISVRQVGGTGLTRFLQAPKLEVIAEMVDPEVVQPAVETAESPTPEPEFVSQIPAKVAEVSEEVPAIRPSALVRLLQAAGLPAQMIVRLKSKPGWEAIERLPPMRALTGVARMLREDFHALPRSPLGDRVAFIGSPGAGKTTALCKWLATDVFVRQRRGVVLKLDLDRPNPSDALAVFCEALGVACARSIRDVPTLAPDQALYIDVPGIVPGRSGEIASLNEALAPLFLTSRVMVINAAYDTELIKNAFDFAERAGATHFVFTHIDELTQCGKVWEFLLDRKLTPLFLGTGPNIAGELDENVFDAVLARTFPNAGLQAAKLQEAQ